MSLIASTTTKTGLKVHTYLDPAKYPTKVKVSGAQMAGIQISEHSFHGEWNYTIRPVTTK